MSQNDAVFGENVEVYRLSESQDGSEDPILLEDGSTARGNKGKKPRRVNQDQENTKRTADPRKYKTKLCRNWKLTGHCQYEHTCCYAHGETEARSVDQNNSVLSSLSYLGSLMLLTLKDEDKDQTSKAFRKNGPKAAASGKRKDDHHKVPLRLAHSPPPALDQQSLSSGRSGSVAESQESYVHSPYSLGTQGSGYAAAATAEVPYAHNGQHMLYQDGGYARATQMPSMQDEGYDPLPGERNWPKQTSYSAHYPPYKNPPQVHRGYNMNPSMYGNQVMQPQSPAFQDPQGGNMNPKMMQQALHDIRSYGNGKHNKNRRKQPQHGQEQQSQE
jgi:hypothetical protein|eukprot:CAMPEP_0174282128 /NCGR_PEP_ID=MMETSP0809-20121228/2585_1 /TAXON_ID=73025 ORGANISM="Eutreptiella gymnastica-like, Strain CCMP1594" /NCGR_SAMPLE_ID=MMETSP0809 /ASSEMBLY_ACC=CAM_ASM_000658 /LENGTH=329 /DNA_ID=CAMNT_0015376125 /DNA_START=39 /DNA_END=1028 /DNA_ORIENTATION=+